ncbi:MAG: hypothetical protein ACN6O0_22355, partial [Achromobacter spanius]
MDGINDFDINEFGINKVDLTLPLLCRGKRQRRRLQAITIELPSALAFLPLKILVDPFRLQVAVQAALVDALAGV